MNEAHIFVCYSALSFDAARRICGALPEETTKIGLALFEPQWTKPAPFDRIWSKSFASRGLNEFRKPFEIASWFSDFLKTLEEYESLVAYVSHPFELPANHFVYSDPRVSRLELLPDGLLNYTSGAFIPKRLDSRARFETRVGLRIASALVHGLKYERLRPGHLTQFEFVNYTRRWADISEGYVTGATSLTALPPRPSIQDRKSASASTLVLDQELAPLVLGHLETRMRATLIDKLREQGVTRLLYRGHPRGENRGQQLRAAGFDVVDATGPGLAEEWIIDSGVEQLYGFYSTPLLLSGKQVRMRHCILPRPSLSGVKNSSQVKEYAEAFAASGAEITWVE